MTFGQTTISFASVKKKEKLPMEWSIGFLVLTVTVIAIPCRLKFRRNSISVWYCAYLALIAVLGMLILAAASLDAVERLAYLGTIMFWVWLFLGMGTVSRSKQIFSYPLLWTTICSWTGDVRVNISIPR